MMIIMIIIMVIITLMIIAMIIMSILIQAYGGMNMSRPGGPKESKTLQS